ncbi:MAG: NAD-dependent epimerase/dehydratase family protein [Actinomycetota bacterium]
MPSTDRVLVTGAAGFIGSHLCRRLVADGTTVVGLDDLSGGTLENLRDVPEVALVQADLVDEAAVASAARGCGAIFHHGAKLSVPWSMEFPGVTTDVNVRGTMNVLAAAHEVGAVVVMASSSAVYGDQDSFPLRESMAPKPRSPYAASKLALEVYGAAWGRAYGVPAVSLRYFNVYGPRQDPESDYAAVIPRFAVACLTGGRPQVHGDGEQSRDFVYIDDVVEANLCASRRAADMAGEAINVGGGASVTVNRLLELIAAECGVTPDPVHTPSRPGDVRTSEADVSLARDLIAFRPRVGIEEGVKRTVDWFRGRA